MITISSSDVFTHTEPYIFSGNNLTTTTTTTANVVGAFSSAFVCPDGVTSSSSSPSPTVAAVAPSPSPPTTTTITATATPAGSGSTISSSNNNNNNSKDIKSITPTIEEANEKVVDVSAVDQANIDRVERTCSSTSNGHCGQQRANEENASNHSMDKLQANKMNGVKVDADTTDNDIHLECVTVPSLANGHNCNQQQQQQLIRPHSNVVGAAAMAGRGYCMMPILKMINSIKTLVSKNKSRYKDGNFNLDLSYIAKNIIAMGFPASTVEGMYRNHIDDVVSFFRQRHPNHYLIFNLCAEPQRRYNTTKFQGFVDTCFTFHDHNPPIFEQLHKFCAKMDSWLQAHPDNVAAVHCKAGKGRTGVMVCAYLVHLGYCIDLEGKRLPISGAHRALQYYGARRTSDGKGVTIQSQRRYIYYYDELVKRQLEYRPRQLKLAKVLLTNCVWNQKEKSTYTINCKILQLNSEHQEPLIIKYFSPKIVLDKRYHVWELPRVYLSGDIKMQLNVSGDPSPYRRRMHQLCFNTALVKYSTDTFTLAVERCTTCAKGFELGKVCNRVVVLGTRNQYLDTTKLSEMDLTFLNEIFEGEVFCHCHSPLLAANKFFAPPADEDEVGEAAAAAAAAAAQPEEDNEPRSVLSILSLRRMFGMKKSPKKKPEHIQGHQLPGNRLSTGRRSSESNSTGLPSGQSDGLATSTGPGTDGPDTSGGEKAKGGVGDDESTEIGLSSMASSSPATASVLSSPKESDAGLPTKKRWLLMVTNPQNFDRVIKFRRSRISRKKISQPPLKSVLGTMVLVFEDDQPYDELDLLVEHNELATKTAGEPDAAAAAADKSRAPASTSLPSAATTTTPDSTNL